VVDIFSKRLGSLKAGLKKTSEALSGGLARILSSGEDKSAIVEDIEELLVGADVGVRTAGEIVEQVRSGRVPASAEAVRSAIKSEIVRILSAAEPRAAVPAAKPLVIMVVGVNGTGKTTTIAKLAKRYKDEGKKVLIAAGDTYRAAAVEQLGVWARRAGVDLIESRMGQDPAAVAYDAVAGARSRGAEVLIIDTAGRLHTKSNLMEELVKVKRVVAKHDPGFPQEVLLVLDATTGQNAISQAKLFTEAVGVTGIALTKLDGTARGGIVIAIAKELGIPVKYIGVGEKLDDLADFDPVAFAEALLGQ
jgi:fused signal recognition particle receptor